MNLAMCFESASSSLETHWRLKNIAHKQIWMEMHTCHMQMKRRIFGGLNRLFLFNVVHTVYSQRAMYAICIYIFFFWVCFLRVRRGANKTMHTNCVEFLLVALQYCPHVVPYKYLKPNSRFCRSIPATLEQIKSTKCPKSFFSILWFIPTKVPQCRNLRAKLTHVWK